jgi:biotin carboxylase
VSTLVVLGGADGAITTVRTAGRIGLRTLCVDRRGDAPALRYADEHLGLSTRDTAALVAALAGRADLVGVVAPASDVNLPSQLTLARRLGLPCGLSEAAVRASVDKGYFRAVCDRLGQPGPRYVQGPPRQVRLAAAGLTFPVMVKPTDSSGGRGVTQCWRPEQLPATVAAAAGWSARGVVIAEECLAGRHYTAEAVVREGRIALFGLGRRVLTPPPHYVTVEHTMPGAPAGVSERVRGMLDEVCRALAYRWGSLNADVLVTPDRRVVLVELGARLGGNGSAELLGLATGVDVTEAYVRMAIGQDPPLAPRRAAFASFRVLQADRPGRLVAIHGVAAARALPEVVDLVVSAAPGEHVEPYHRAGAKAGYLLTVSPDRDRLRATLARVATLLRVEVAPVAPAVPKGVP